MTVPAMPKHLSVGRAAYSGPTIGGLHVFEFGPFSYSTNATFDVGFVAPCALRVQAVGFRSRARAATATFITYQNENGVFGAGAPAKALHATVNADAQEAALIRAVAAESINTSDILVGSARDIPKSSAVFARIIISGGGSLSDFHWIVIANSAGFPLADPAND